MKILKIYVVGCRRVVAVLVDCIRLVVTYVYLTVVSLAKIRTCFRIEGLMIAN